MKICELSEEQHHVLACLPELLLDLCEDVEMKQRVMEIIEDVESKQPHKPRENLTPRRNSAARRYPDALYVALCITCGCCAM